MMAQRAQFADILESLLLATDRPLAAGRIASVVPRISDADVPALVDELNRIYEEEGRSFRVRNVAGGYRLYTLPEYQSYVDALAVTVRETRLSQAALETLAVVAYRQPVCRSDIEFVRGCDSDGVLRTLLSRKLIAIKGRSDAPGRPLLYGTTDKFLEYFGLARIDDLPDWGEIEALVGDALPRVRLTLARGEEVTEAVSRPHDASDEAPPFAPEAADDGADMELEPVGVAAISGEEPLPPGDET